MQDISTKQMELDQLCQLLYSKGFEDTLIDRISNVILFDTTFGLGSLLYDSLVANGSSLNQSTKANDELPF